MRQNVKLFFKKRYLITQLMHIYSLLLTGIILLAMAALCGYVVYTQRVRLDSQEKSILSQMDTFITNKNEAVTNMTNDLVGAAAKVENLRNYIRLTPEEYFNYIANIWSDYHVEVNFAASLKNLFYVYPELEEVYLYLDEFDVYLKADHINLNGVKLHKPLAEIEGFHLMRVIADPYTGQAIGKLYAVFSEETILGSQQNELSAGGLSTFVYSNAGHQIFSANSQLNQTQQESLNNQMQQNENLTFLEKNYTMRKLETSGGATIVLLARHQVFWTKVLQNWLVIFAVGILLISLLLLVLKQTFKRYTTQVDLIVAATRSVGAGRMKERIDVSLVQSELLDIATAINLMIEHLEQYIEDIYTLEIKQRDANMRALQSQINPHFLYNTLEYIRMYALSRQQTELAEVVYAFSALLRNNIDQSKTTNLEKEILFCEKYVYLYQMRYPDAFAYNMSVADAVRQVAIPKFVIQPLVENYFVHGIDYERKDNALSVTAYKKAQSVVIKVIDNGKGMSDSQLKELKRKLESSEVELIQSIGIRNVHERLQRFLGASYQMDIQSARGKGTEITISFNLEE